MKLCRLQLVPMTLIIYLLAGSITPTASDLADAFNWWILRPDAPVTFSNMAPHSLGITSTGVVHIVYGGDHLYHISKNGITWAYETVDPAWGVGSFASLAIDGAGKLHVSYIDKATGILKYATNRSGSWQLETPSIAAGMWVGNAVIAVDAGNDPHILFYSGGALHYGFFDGGYGAWVGPETVAIGTGSLDYAGAFALAVGPLATPHVSFHKHVSDTNGSLNYTRRTGPYTWTAPLVLAAGGDSDGDYNDIALNGSIPYVAASSVATVAPSVVLNVVRFTFLDGATWHPSEPVTVATNNSTPAPPAAIVLRLVGSTPFIAYQDPGAGYYWQYRLGDNNWSTADTIDAGATAGTWSSFAMYGNYPYATVYDSTSRMYAFRYKNAGGWQTPTYMAFNGYEVGDSPSVAVDSLGRSHMTYGYNYPAQRLKYVRYDGTNWTSLAVDTGPVRTSSTLVLENDLPRVIYMGTDGSVRYSIMNCSPVCTFTAPEILDSGLSTPLYRPTLAFHATTGMHAVYYKNGSLIYARRLGSNSWSQTIIDSGTNGPFSLSLDPSGAPHVMYRKAGTLYYAYKDTTWHTGITIATGTFGYRNSLQVGPQGQIAAAYIEYTGNAASVIYSSRSCFQNNCFWVSSTVAPASGMTDDLDLAFDSKGVPHIAYFGPPGDTLRYAERTSPSTWVTKAIDGRGWSGYPSIAISPRNGRARIVYCDMTNADLKLAFEGEPLYLPLARK